MANNYWTQRAKENEEKAQRQAKNFSKNQQKFYREAYKKIDLNIDGLFTQIMENGAGAVSRTELWRYSKYIELRNTIEKEVGGLGRAQITLMEEHLNKVFTGTLQTTLDDLGKGYNFYNQSQVKQFLNTSYKGSHFSDRVWNNTNQLTTRLQEGVSEIISLGKMPSELKARLQEELNVSYRMADRLVRTETSHTFNSAALAGYKEAGVAQVEFIPERDDDECDDCADAGGIYDIGTEPQLPLHPNCRCCYAPVIDLRA